MTPITPGMLADAATTAARDDLLAGTHRAVIVDSPPGAGKSTFVVATAAALVDHGIEQVPIVAQTNAQSDDLVRSLLRRHPGLSIGRLTGSDKASTALTKDDGCVIAPKLDSLADCHVVVGTAAKWGYVAGDLWPYEVGIVDEAYQMRSDQLLYVAPAFERALFVGDPGQLDPFSPIDDNRWRGYADGPITPAVATVLHNDPDSPVHRLPVSWRLPATAAPLVSDAFYPTMPFRAGSGVDERMLSVGRGGDDAVDAAILTAAESGWAYLELPERIAPPTDREAVATVAAIVVRLFQRGVDVHDTGTDPVDSALEPRDVAIGVVHRNQRAAVRVELERRAADAGLDLSDVVVDTANRLQGREFHVVVVLHPLSGRAVASEFHLETGRLCVLLSRHRHACIVVGRAGIADVLDAHPADTPIWIGAPVPVPDGWEANQVVLERLLTMRPT